LPQHHDVRWVPATERAVQDTKNTYRNCLKCCSVLRFKNASLEFGVVLIQHTRT
jgi:hypothetical protein